MSRDLAASVRARLKECADTTKQDFNLALTHYGLERLLYRLSVSTLKKNRLAALDLAEVVALLRSEFRKLVAS